MAPPIPLQTPPRDPRAELLTRLQNAPAEHAEAILGAMEVLQGLHDRGVLELLRGALGSSEQVLEIAVNAASSPQSIRSIRNLLLLVNMLGEIDPERLKSLTRAVPPALNDSASLPSPGIFQLVGSTLWNNNFRRGVSTFASLMASFGSNSACAPTESA